MEIADEETTKRFLYAQFEDALRQEVNHSIKERVERYCSVHSWKFTPHTYFAPISAECRLLYRDGYFFACIALCQSVAEALSKFLCENFFGKAASAHERRIIALRKNLKISVESETSFKKIHEHRNDYHHFNPGVPTDREHLQNIAFEALKELSKIENEIFAFSYENGIPIPKFPELWPTAVINAIIAANSLTTPSQR